MLKRLSFTLTVTASLTGLYWLYALSVTPRLSPRTLLAQQRAPVETDEPKFEPPPTNIQNAERFLSDAPWAAGAEFQIAMATGVLFTKSWRLKDQSQNIYEFRPFAMIWSDTPGDGEEEINSIADKQPMTLVSESGLVQFSAEFDPVNRKYGRVIGGRLEGEVIASGPNGMTIRGRDFFFNEKTLELYSASPVEFRFQQHRGTADHGFSADLLPSAAQPRPDDFLAIAGFRQVTMRGHVELQLVNQGSTLRVTCEESFKFNPEQQVAMFQGNVNARRPTANGEPDQLKSDDHLLLVFDNSAARGGDSTSRSRGDAPSIVPILRGNAPKELSAAAPIHNDLDSLGGRQSPSANNSQYVLRELRATGRRVEFDSPSNGLSVHATSLVYEVASRLIKLAVVPGVGKSNRSDLNAVYVRHQPSLTELTCPKLELTHDEDGQVVSAHGGGPGRMTRRVMGSGKVEFSAKWQSHFDLQQLLESELNLLTLVGGAVIQQPPRESGLKAEQIQLWYERPSDNRSPINRSLAASDEVDPLQKPVLNTLPVRQTGQAVASQSAIVAANDAATHVVPDDTNHGFRPRQLQAQDKVIVISPQMNVETQRFIVNFEDGSPSPSELAGKPNSRSRVRQAAGHDSESDANSKSKEPGKNKGPKPAGEPLQLSADLVRARVRLVDDARQVADSDEFQAELTEVWTEGNVDIQQPREGDTEPLRLLGDRLHLRNASREGAQVLHVFGQPAMVRARGFDIEGQEIFFDRSKNRVWIDRAGELRMPVKNDPVDGRELSSPTLLTVWWKEKMLFDGQTATFLGDVKGVLKNSRLQCEEMEVVLTRQLSFSDDAGPAPAAEVQLVTCKDGVVVDHTLYANEVLTEIRHGEFATLTLNQSTGRMEAGGPGKIDLWRPGQGKRAGLAPRAVAQANRPLESDVSNWDFTRVTFQGNAIGNLRDRQTKFQDRVHIVYGPVGHPFDVIDPDHLPKDGGDMECDSLQILQVKPAGTQKPHIELEAKGNAKLEGRSFNARADEITFDESKKLYTLRATGNRQATIWRQTTLNGEPSEASAKTWWFIPSTNYLRSDQTTGIRGTN